MTGNPSSLILAAARPPATFCIAGQKTTIIGPNGPWLRPSVRRVRVLGRFLAGFRGKASPVHFWGAFDLAGWPDGR